MIPKHHEVRFEVTTRCNYNCVFCGNEWVPNATMSFKLFKQLIDKVFNETNQYTTVSFVGIGEPLMDKNLEKKVKYTRKKYPGVFIPITTNGLLLTPARFISLKEAGVNSFRISLQGTTPETYAEASGVNPRNFYKVEENILQIYPLKGKTILIVTFITNNKQDLDKMIREKAFWENTCDLLEVWTPHNHGAVFSYREIQKRRKKTCGLIFNGPLIVFVSGNIAMCCMDIFGDHILGNLRTQSLQEIFNSKQYKRIAECHKTGEYFKVKTPFMPCAYCDQLNWDKSEALIYNSKFKDYKRRVAAGSPIFNNLVKRKN